MATLKEIGASYRAVHDILRLRIQEVRELPAKTEEERIGKEERLRMLAAMRRDVREMAVICERYYDRRFHPNERFLI